ncbi:MAG: rhomboid family intramembrane serine protease [Pyrinomonadaceae bacterium]
MKVLSEGQLHRNASVGRPSMCRNCGAIVGAGQEACTMCGTPAGGAQTQETSTGFVADRETMRFARAVLSRPYIFTIIFLVANIFVFLLTYLSAGSVEDTARFDAVLIAYGAKMNSLINQGEWWRLVTPIFLHGNWTHLLMNMYGLWILGPYVERLYGSAKFVVFWVLTGVAGVLASYLTVRPALHHGLLGRFLFKAEDVASVGASGALFGLIGVLFVFGIKFRHELPEGFKRAFGVGMLPTILINVVIGIIFPFIDNAAHIGGLVSGAALALLVGYKRPHERASVATVWHVLQFAALCLVALSFWEVARHYKGPPPSLSNASMKKMLPGTGNSAVAFLKAINEGEEAFLAATNEGKTDKMDQAITSIQNAPRLDEQSGKLLDELKPLLERARDGANDKRSKPLERAQQKKALLLDYQAWQERLLQWVKTEGNKYGLVIDTSKADGNAPGDSTNGQQPSK